MTALEEIKKALAEATLYPGPWEVGELIKRRPYSDAWELQNATDLFGYIYCGHEEPEDVKHVVEYIAAVNPAAISELLSTLESLQRDNEELRQRLDIGPCGEDAIDVAESAADHLRHRAEAAEAEVKRYRSALIAKEPSDRMLIAGSLVDWKKYSDKKEAARDVWNVMHRNADGPALASREGDTHKPVAYVCAADMELLGKSSDGWDFSMSPKPRPDLGMNMALYAAPLTETSKPDPVLWVSPVDLRAWQKAKAGEIWAWSENIEGQCIPLYTALASTGGEHHAE